MESLLDTRIIPAFLGLLAGAISSLIAPWVHWGVEKRKLRLQTRAELIKEAREALECGNHTNEEFRHLSVYSRIRPFLSAHAIKAVEGETPRGNPFSSAQVIRIVAGNGRHSGVNPFRAKVLDELTELEKKWGLV